MKPSVNLSFSFYQNLFRAQGSLAASTSRQALRSSRASHRSQITKASSPTEQTVFPLAQWQSGLYQVFAVFDVREGLVFRVFLEELLITKTIHIDPSSAALPQITKATVTQKEAYERVCEGLSHMKLKIEDGIPNLLVLKIHGSLRGGAPVQDASSSGQAAPVAADATVHEPLSELRTTRALALRLRKLEATDPLFAPLKDQARDCIRNFRAKAVVTSGDIAELAQLAIVSDGGVIREVLESLLDRLNSKVLFDPMLLRGLTTAIEYADPEHIRSDDLVSILKYLKERLEKLPTTDKPRLVKELSALAALLDAMVLAKVDDIDAKGIHEELIGYLSKFVRSDFGRLTRVAGMALAAKELVENPSVGAVAESDLLDPEALETFESKDFELSALAKSSIQALKRIPTDESAIHKYFHRLLHIGEGVSLLAQAWGDKSLSSAAEGLKELYKGVKIGTRKKEWYETLQFLKLLIRQGAYAEVQKALVEEVKREKGALHFIWSGDHGKEFFYLLAQQIYALPDRERALALQEIKGLPNLNNTVTRLEAVSRSALSRASVRPEWRLQVYKESQMGPSEEADLYTPPRGSRDPVGFTNPEDLAYQARRFLDPHNPQKVFLLQGRSGSGKSLFLENLSKELWESCHSLKDPIPVLIRLAGIDPKDPKFIEHYLRDQVGIPEIEISKLKAEGRFIFFLDGYDEMPGQPLVNLYESADLKEWSCKVFIGCRTQHLARISNPDHYFAPLEDERLRQDLLEKVYVVPFAQDQMEDFLEKHARAHPAPDWDAQRLLQTIKDIPGLFEMAQSPFILGMAASALPKLMQGESDARTLKVTRTKLYDSFVEQWFERQKKKLPSSLQSRVTLEAALRFCEQLASKMAKKNCHEAVYSPHQSIFSGDEASEWDNFFKSDNERLALVRRCAPIASTPLGFAFVHRSVLDHFVVRAGKKSIQAVPAPDADDPVQSDVRHWDLVHRESAEPYTTFDIDSTQSLVERFNQDLKPYEQKKLKELALGVISAFKLPANRATIQELVFLAGSKDPDIARGVLEVLIGPIKTGTTVSLPLMEGLASALSRLQLDMAEVQGAQENIKTNLLICLGVICTKLADLHQSGSDHSLFNELNVLGRLVDALLDAGVVAEGSKTQEWIDLLGGVSSGHPQIAAQAEYIKEGMRRLKTDESRLGMFLKRAGHIASGLSSIIEGVNSYSPLKVYKGLKEFRKATKTKGFKHSWYEEVRLATLFVRCPSKEQNPNAGLENIEAFRTWREEACREKEVSFKDKLFKKGATKEGTLRDEAAFALIFALDTQIQRRQSDEMRSAWIAELGGLALGASEPVVHGVQCLIGIYDGYDDLEELSRKAIEEAKGALQPSAASGISGSAGFELFAYSLHPPQFTGALLSAAKQSGSWLLARLGVEAMNDPTVLEEKSSHVPLHLAPKKGDLGKPLEDVFEAFFSHESQWVLLLLGDSGSGKSLSTKLQAAGQWAMRHESARDDKPIPLFISLTGVERTSTTIVEDHLKELGFTEAQVQELKSRQFIFYLDGYDEMRGDETTNIITQNPFVGLERRLGWRGKVIVSCRTQYAEQRGDYEHYKQWFEPEGGDEFFQKVTTVPFGQGQIDKYLEQFSSHVQNWTKADYQRYINTIPGVRAMIKTPFMLRLLAEVLPSIVADRGQEDEGAFELTRSDCYSAFLDLWFYRQLDKLIRGGHGDLSATEVIGYREFAEQLAKGMGQESEVSYTPTDPDDPFGTEEDLNSYPARFLSNECLPIVIRARTACPLRVWRSGDAIAYSFIHDSLRDFLGSRQAFEKAPLDAAGLAELMEHKIEEAEAVGEQRLGPTTSGTEVVAIDVEGIKSDFGKYLITKEIERIKFYTDDVHQDAKFKQRLFTIIELSKTDKELSIAAANAITVLVAANEPLCEKDFRGISIPGAVIDGGNFSHSLFDGADLTNVSMQGVSIGGASFQGCKMSGVNFGELPTLDGHEGAVNHLLAFADGTRLASSSDDKTVRVWDVATGQMQSCLEGHSASQGPLALVGGNRLAAGGSDGQVRVWDIGSERLLRTLCGRVQTEAGKCIAVRTVGIAYNEETDTLTSGGYDDRRINVRELEGNPTVAKVAEDKTTALLVDKEYWIQGTPKGDIYTLDLKTGDKDKTLSGHTQEVTVLALSPGKEHLISGSLDKTIRAWNVAEATSFKTFEGHGAAITGLSFTILGQEFASISFDKTARIWELMKGVCLRTIALDSEGLDVAYLQDDQILATAGLKGKISLWKLDTQPLAFAPEEHSGAITALSMNQTHTELATGSEDTSVRLWELKRGTLRHVLGGHNAKVTTLSYAPDGSRLASGSIDRTVIVWDTVRGLLVFRLDHALFPIEKVSYLSGGRKLVVRGSNQVVHVWEACSGLYKGQAASLEDDSDKVAGIALEGRSWYQLRTHSFLIELLEQLQELCLNSGDRARAKKAEAMANELRVRKSKIKRKKTASVRRVHQPRAIEETGHRGGVQIPQEKVSQLLSEGIEWTELLFKGYEWLDSGEKELATEALRRATQMQVALLSHKGECDGAEITVVKLIKRRELEVAEQVFEGISQAFVWEPGQVKSVLEAGVEVDKDWAKGFCVSEALQGTIGMIKDAMDRSRTLVEIVKAQSELGEVSAAKETLTQAKKTAKRIEDTEKRSDTLVSIAKAQLELGEVSGAKETLVQAKKTAKRIEDTEDRFKVLAKIMKVQAQLGEILGAKEALAQARETVQRIEGDNSQSWALVEIAEAQLELGELLGAKESLAQAQEAAWGMEDDWGQSRVLVKIAEVQVQAGDVSGAKKTVQGLDDFDDRSWALVSIAKVQAQLGEVSAAKETLVQAKKTVQRIEGDNSQSWALVEIAEAQLELGEVSAAKETLMRAKKIAKRIEDTEKQSDTLVSIAKAQLELGEVLGAQETLVQAQKVASGVENTYSRSKVLCEIAKAQLELGEVLGAQETLVQAQKVASGVENTYSRSKVLCEIAKAQVQAGGVSGAKKVLAQAQETAKGIEDANSRSRALVSIAKAQLELGEVSAAKKTANRIEDADSRFRALVSIAKAQLELGEVSAAKKTANRIEDADSRFRALASITKTQLELGGVSGAKEVLAQAQEAAQRIEGFEERSGALIGMAKAQLELGKVLGAKEALAQAQETAKGIKGDDSQSRALVSIAKAQLELGEVSVAKEILEQAYWVSWILVTVDGGSKVFCEVAKVRAQAGEVSDAKWSLAQAQKRVEVIEDAYFRSWALVEIAKAQSELGEVSGAKVSLAQAQETAKRIRYIDGRSWVLSEIAEVQAQAGEVSAAKKTANRIEDALHRSEALVSIAKAQAQAGEVSGAKESLAQAQETAKGIRHTDDRSRALSRALVEIAKAQLEAGDLACLKDSLYELDLQALIRFCNEFAQIDDLDVSGVPFPLFLRIFQNIITFNPSVSFFRKVFCLCPSISLSQFQEVLQRAVHKWGSLFKSGDTYTSLFSGLGEEELLMFQEHIQSAYQALSEKSDLSSIFYVMGWVAAYNACIRKKIDKKEFEGIWPLLKKLPDPFVRSRLTLELTKAQLGEGRWLEAIQNAVLTLEPKAVLELVSQSTELDQTKVTQLAECYADKPEVICELAGLKGETPQAESMLVEAFTKAYSKAEPDLQTVWALRAYIEKLEELNLHKRGIKQMRRAVVAKIQALCSPEERSFALQGFSKKEQSALGNARELGIALTQENSSFESRLQAARLFATSKKKRLFKAAIDDFLGICESKIKAIQKEPVRAEPMIKVRSGRFLVAKAADFSGAEGLTEEQNGLLKSKGALFQSLASTEQLADESIEGPLRGDQPLGKDLAVARNKSRSCSIL